MKLLILNIIILFLYNCSALEIATHEIKTMEKSNNKKENIFELMIEDPYQIDDIWFYPKIDKDFNKIGFANKIQNLKVGSKTSNGEYYHPHNLIGAHATLPLPSTVNVTNIINGYSVNIRINHRGGFSKTSIIDLSPEAFKILNLNGVNDLVRVSLVDQNESFILKYAKTYTEEILVDNAPVLSVSIKDLEDSDLYEVISSDISQNENIKSKFPNSFKIKEINNKKIYINIAKFTFLDSAKALKDSLDKELNILILETYINKKKYYNVAIGPFTNLSKMLKVINEDILTNYEDLSIIIF